MKKYVSKTIEDTYALAKTIADTLVGNEIILLDGDLGAGKTTFTKGLARALGIDATVTSPTFTLMKTYHGGRLCLYHFDLYRVHNPEELQELGFDEYFDCGGVCVIEWNKYVCFPNKQIKIKISYVDSNQRIFEIEDER